jgi:hypothetical protein
VGAVERVCGLDKPKRPGRRAGPEAWDRYHTDMAAWRDEQRGPQHVQHRDRDTTVRVRSGYSADHDTPTSDFIVADRMQPGHSHVVYDEDGNEIVNHWRDR